MKNPCKTCMERDLCRGEFPCRVKQKYNRWKDGVSQIRRKFRGEKANKA